MKTESQGDSRSFHPTEGGIPVGLQHDALRPESQLFLDFCDELKEVHVRKAHDYGNSKDPLGNFEQARDWGLTPLQGIMVRIGDKIARLQSFMIKGNLQNESVDDTLTDLAAYALLAKVLLRRIQNGPQQDRIGS